MNPVERLLGAVINPVVDAVDVDGVVSKVDVDRLVNEVDLDTLLEKVDLDALLARIDVDALLDRIDVDQLLERVDIDKLAGRLDVQALVERLDVQSVVDKVDLDAVLRDVDVAAITRRAGIDDIVSEATRGVGSRVLAMARRQVVGLDLIVSGIWAKLVRRPRPAPPSGATATGAVAGPVSRLLAYFVDIAVLSVGFTVTTAILGYLGLLFFGQDLDSGRDDRGWAFAAGYLLFAGLYWLVGLSVAGSSIGKALLGLRVLNLDGRPLKGRQALVRVIAYPFSFILGLGLMPIVTARSHRALHDKVARTTVRYDWGDSSLSSRSPLTRWMRGKSAATWVLADEERAEEPPARGHPMAVGEWALAEDQEAETAPADELPTRARPAAAGSRGGSTNRTAGGGSSSNAADTPKPTALSISAPGPPLWPSGKATDF